MRLPLAIGFLFVAFLIPFSPPIASLKTKRYFSAAAASSSNSKSTTTTTTTTATTLSFAARTTAAQARGSRAFAFAFAASNSDHRRTARSQRRSIAANNNNNNNNGNNGSSMWVASDAKANKGEGSSSTSASTGGLTRLESPSAERNKGPIWDVLEARAFRPAGLIPSTSGSTTSSNDGAPPPPPIPPPSRCYNVLEIAAGAGVHTTDFVGNLLSRSSSQNFRWYPTDPDDDCLESLRSRANEIFKGGGGGAAASAAAIAPPMKLTLADEGIHESETTASLLPFVDLKGNDVRDVDLVVCVNMIHISPWSATLGLMRVAGKHLREPNENENDQGGLLYCYGPYKVDGKAVQSNLNFDESLRSRNPDWGVRNVEDVVKAADDEGLELLPDDDDRPLMIEMPANNLSLIFRRKRENANRFEEKDPSPESK